PELYAAELATRRELWRALSAHVAADRPVLAECGGMMSLFTQLRDQSGHVHTLGNLLPGEVVMQPRLSALGTQTVTLPEGDFRGHTFHYSKATTSLTPIAHATPFSTRRHGRAGEAIYRQQRLTASYLHLYFPSNPVATAHLFLP
ncbi:MAG: cobyrinate a,c-diamide synthase, partial [Candidatus Competibacteraceae bacterium]|nr:cobyrinate a,c-diamide synthase [Candidatus Competibacteraceae bacterium]